MRVYYSPSAAGASSAFDAHGYCRRVIASCGEVLLTGLLTEKNAAAVPIEAVYVPLEATRPVGAALRLNDESRERGLGGARLGIGELSAGLADKLSAESPDEGARNFLAAMLREAGATEDELADEAVSVELWARLRALPRPLDPERLHHAARVISMARAIQYARCVLVEGDPGAGKTTTLKYIATALARANAAEADTTGAAQLGFAAPFPLPVFVSLRELTGRFETCPAERRHHGAELLVEYMCAAVEPLGGGCSWLASALDEGRVVLLLDGLDELVDPEVRGRVAAAIAELLSRHSRARCMLSSRPSGLAPTERLRLKALAHCVVQPLSDGHVRRFVEAWYQALITDPDEAIRRGSDLIARLQGRPKVLELARTPIMLTAIAVVHQTQVTIPERRADLFEACVRALCHQWDLSKGPEGARLAGDLGLDEKVAILQAIAHELHSKGTKEAVLERGPIEAIVGRCLAEPGGVYADRAKRADVRRAVLESLAERSGLLVPRGSGEATCVGFRHLAFQEYLTARFLCDETADVPDRLDLVLDDPWWREVVLLAPAYQAARARRTAADTVRLLAKQACARRDELRRCAALARVAEAIADLREYRVPDLAEIVASITPVVVDLLSTPAQPGSLEDRLALGHVLGAFGDPRLSEERRWVRIEEGTGWRGAVSGDGGAFSWEDPGSWIRTGPFWIQRWTVTRGEYDDFVEAGGYEDDENWSAAGLEWRRPNAFAPLRQFWGGQPLNLPANAVSWFEAEAYCRWADRVRRMDLGVPDGWVIRLPTEAEWERAARADEGAQEARRVFPWGDDWDKDNAASAESGLERPAPVGLFPAGHGPRGLWDQAGNVFEWCVDWFHREAYGAGDDLGLRDPVLLNEASAGFERLYRGTDSKGEEIWEEGRARVLRGGSFWVGPRRLRVSYRSRIHPANRDDIVGFRCVAAPPRRWSIDP